MKDFWEQRYSEDGLAYGDQPNEFLVSQTSRLTPGKCALVVGDGEGRNGVWLARHGLNVTTVDYARAGVERARALAKENDVSLNAIHADLNHWDWPENSFDYVVSIFLHFPSEIRPSMHEKMLAALKPGGEIIMEAFNKEQLAYPSGGPPVEDALFSADILRSDFADAEIEVLEECVVELNEGKYHVGPGAVVRFIARKSG